MDWKSIAGAVGKAAPVLGTLLGGPAGPAIGAMIASALGTSADPDVVSEALSNNPDALVKLRQIEADKATKLQELVVEQAKTVIQTEAADRDSARKMQQATGSYIPAALAVVVTLGFFAVLALLVFHGKPEKGGDALMIMVGSLGGAWSTVMAFYFGTTSNSIRKTELLAQSAPAK
jgi:hypothetical protein